MNNVKLKIYFSKDTISGSELHYNEFTFNNFNINNISSVSELDKDIISNSRPFLFGTSKFNENTHFAKTYGGIISKENINEINGTPSLEIVGKNIKTVAIQFDKESEVYPTKVYTSLTKEIENNSSLIILNFPTAVNAILIEFREFNRIDKPIMIDAVYPSLVKEYGNREIAKLNIGSEIDNNSSPSYSIIGKYGSVEINDFRKEFTDFLNKGLLDQNVNVVVTYNDTDVFKMKGKKWTQSSDTLKYSIELTDETYFWNNRYIDKIQFVASETKLDTLFEKIMKSKDISISDNYRDEIKPYFNTFGIENLYSEDRITITEFLNSICNITLTSMKIDRYGKLEVFRNV